MVRFNNAWKSPAKVAPRHWTAKNSRRRLVVEAAANRLIDKIDDAAVAYATQPELGQLRPERHPDFRCFIFERFVDFYLPKNGDIELVQLSHAHGDIPEHFRKLLRG